MQQEGGPTTPPPPYAPLLARLRGDEEALVVEVVHDVAQANEPEAVVAALVRPVVAWTIDALAEAETLRDERLALLHDEGRRAAIAGESLQRLLDRYLSTGWVVWGAATRAATDADAPAVPALGTALLKAGDAAAAAIASGYGEAERALALRAAGARREFMDEVLDLAAGDAEAAARLRRRAAEFGLDPAGVYRLVVASLGHDVPDGGTDLEALNALLAPADRPFPRRPGTASSERHAGEPLVSARRGRIVVILATDGPLPAALEPALDQLAGGPWLAVAAPPVVGLSRLADAYGTAIEALSVAGRLERIGLLDADEVLLERALLADEPLLVQAVGRELGPILGARRNPRALVETLDAFLASAENLRATARRLGVAPRTVAYRMTRIERLLGGPVRGPRAQRLATALLAARLLPPRAVDEVLANAARSRSSQGAAVARAPAGRSRQVPPGRSRTRRCRGTAR